MSLSHLHEFDAVDIAPSTEKLHQNFLADVTFSSFDLSNSMTAFNYAEFHLKVRTDIIPTGDDIIVTDAFFEKATLVLLDVPDWCCISAYVLLIVICAEALLQVFVVCLLQLCILPFASYFRRLGVVKCSYAPHT